jgi:type I restriction enzyme S subunit
VGLSYNNGMITGAYDVYSINEIEPKFLEYYFIAIDDVKGLRPLYTGLRKVINKDRFLQMQIPIPTDAEQQTIVEYLDKKCSSIDKIMDTLNEEINFLNEYRTRLISDVVTGKLDVRDMIVPEYEAVGDVGILETDEDDIHESED